MPTLESGPYSFDLCVHELLGDIAHRSLAGARYLVKIGFRDAADLCFTGFANEDPSTIRTDGTRITDDTPDQLYLAFSQALFYGRQGIHRTHDNRLTIAVNSGSIFKSFLVESLDFRGDPDNVFSICVCINPFERCTEGVPIGGGVAIVLVVHRNELERFVSSLLNEIEQAPRSKGFNKSYLSPDDLLRWIPKRRKELAIHFLHQLRSTYKWFPLEVYIGPGWLPLIEGLCRKIQRFLNSQPKYRHEFHVTQCKRKNGRLMFNALPRQDEIADLIEATSSRALMTCEVCGKPGTIRSASSGGKRCVVIQCKHCWQN